VISTTFKISFNILLSVPILTIISQILTRYSAHQMGADWAVHQLFIDFKKACDSVRRVFYNILTEFGIPMKLVWLIKVCLNKTYSTVHIHKHLMHFLLRRV